MSNNPVALQGQAGIDDDEGRHFLEMWHNMKKFKKYG